MPDSNKKSARYILIDTLIELLHKKTFQKITVNELCETARLSRSSFYANFNDKYDLLFCCLERITERMDTMLTSCSKDNFYIFVLDYIHKENRFFYNAFHSEPDAGTMMVMYRFFERHLTQTLELKTSQGITFPQPLEVTCAFYIGGLVTTTLEWIRNGYKPPKEDVAKCLNELLKDVF